MNYYAYRMMIRTNEENVILKCRRLFQKFAVDMYVKVETERLAFIRFNQSKLRSEDYIHLRDAIHSEGDVQNIGRLTILPSSYIGSPRHMHEYAQDAMTYVRNYGTPDLFITFTCNPKWTEIERELEPGQKPQDRHDIIARVFHQKLKVMMDVLTKYRVFGDTRCYMYSVEWQKRGLPHAHILIWLLNKLHSNEVDDIISAEIPDPVTDPHLHDIVTTQMVHGPCGDPSHEFEIRQESARNRQGKSPGISKDNRARFVKESLGEPSKNLAGIARGIVEESRENHCGIPRDSLAESARNPR
nr:uncharacterized protein LOC121502813 [Drosophila kikkawai]